MSKGPQSVLVPFTHWPCGTLVCSKEERAALVIQRQWRSRQQHKPGEGWLGELVAT